MMADVGPRAEIVLAHQERVVFRVDSSYVKVEVDGIRLRSERAALDAAPVPAPRVLWFVDGPPAALAMTAVTGRQLARHGEEPAFGPETWRSAGALTRRIHDAPAPAGLKEWFVAGGLAHWVEGMRTWLLDDGRVDHDVVEAHASFAHRHLDDRPLEPVFTHGDLQCEHVLVDDDGEITGVIDWGDAGLGDRTYDVASLTCGNEELLDAVLDGYGADVPIDRDVVRAYWSLRRLGSVRWMTEHGYDPVGDVAALEMTRPT
jgi:aminoglycoside phosphotransferase (APT) family kinase protein